MSIFTHNLNDLLYLSSTKQNLVKHLKKNYKENIHYIIKKNKIYKSNNGGQNEIIFLLTEKTYEILKNSYNIRNRYIVNVSDNIKMVNIGMCIENQTIGFIENSFKNIVECKRQYSIGKYRIDLYFIDYKLAIECDENNHIDRNLQEELIRENYIISLGNNIIRYNPNTIDFDLSNVLRTINKKLFNK
jgi:very-short-patch-repair endonuclease